MAARYIVGIDLGTTNSAVAYVDAASAERAIHSLAIPQLVAESAVADRPTLPSFLYVGGEHELAPGALAVPWDPARDFAVGEFARAQGARVPGRLVSSAKSWLCHGGVDRESAILPWAAPDDVRKLSPVEASARYLAHVREAWTQRFPDAPLEQQDVVLTVPASFDEVARELTVAAAARAGLPRATLLEEPQAAFYAWIGAHADDWQARLRAHRLVLVIDVGGGTTDFSLIRIEPQGDTLALERLAVGDHILLGGDNIDVALARLLEPRLGERLDTQRWQALTTLCRAAKETLLGDEPPPEVPIRLGGRGRAVIGGSASTALARDEVERLVLDGFFPLVPADARPRRTPRAGLQEWGLPYAAEAEVSRHLAAFLAQHAGDGADGDAALGFPDAVLFNGGALTPPLVRSRLGALLASWHGGREPAVLESPNLDLAVSRGAAYYGLVRRGLGVRIGGGSARAYYLGLAASDELPPGMVDVVCLAPRGMREGETVEITSPTFTVLANRPVSFPLFASSTRLGDAAGAVLRAERESLHELPPIRTVLRFGRKLAATELPAHIGAGLTEVGTLEVWCHSLSTQHRWRLQFALREAGPGDDEESPAESGSELAVSAERLAAATAAITDAFPADGAMGGDPLGLMRALESGLDAGRDAWPIAAIRPLWDALFAGGAARGLSQAHEARWLNLCGFLLRPGFGHELDEWRIQQLWKLYSQGLRFPRAVQCRVEWWGLWKRIAGGLSRAQQQELFNQTAPFLVPRLKSRAKEKRSLIGPQELREYWQLLASCERLAAEAKAELGAVLLPAVVRGKATDAEIWALGRLGSRAPFAGPLNCVVARATVESWASALLEVEWPRPSTTAFALVQLARAVGDRERDLDEGLRHRLAERLRTLPHGERAARLVTEVVPLEGQERARILDESLPVGLQLAQSEHADASA
ncbi:MAG: Hsp70 family protein [Candidatus Binatia bacterium]